MCNEEGRAAASPSSCEERQILLRDTVMDEFPALGIRNGQAFCSSACSARASSSALVALR
jgi:hypothetical protein